MIAAASQPLSTPEIAEMHGVHVHTVVNWIKRGLPRSGKRVFLPAYKAGGIWRVHQADLDAFLAVCTLGGLAVKPATPRQEQRAAERDQAALMAALKGKG